MNTFVLSQFNSQGKSAIYRIVEPLPVSVEDSVGSFDIRLINTTEFLDASFMCRARERAAA